MSRATILLVEDDANILRANRGALDMEGYRVVTAQTLAQAKECVEKREPDLIVLDIMLPDGNGLEYCRELRGNSGVRILFLSAKNEPADLIAGLQAGGDDYISKPYLMAELMARIEALLRRGRLVEMAEPPLRLGPLEMNFVSRRARLDGRDLLLSTKEFTLLELLVRARCRYLSATELYEKVWGMDAVGDIRTVKVHISSIRRKLGGSFAIEVGRKEGYRLVEQPPEKPEG